MSLDRKLVRSTKSLMTTVGKNEVQLGRRLLSAGPETQCKRRTWWICSHIAPRALTTWLCGWNLFVPQSACTWFSFCFEPGPSCLSHRPERHTSRMETCTLSYRECVPQSRWQSKPWPSPRQADDMDVPNISPNRRM